MAAGELDPHKSTQITIVGKKRSGKTELGWLLFESYPFDRVLVDPNADIKVDEETTEDVDGILGNWPSRMVGDDPKRRRTLRHVPDFGDDDYREKIDRVVGMAYAHPKTLLMIDEAHEAAPETKTLPHMRRALRHSRHRTLSTIYITPRPKKIDTLMLSQADWVYVFKLPNPDDRQRVAETIGWHPKDFDDAVHGLGPHEYLRHGPKDPSRIGAAGDDGDPDELVHMPAIPESRIVGHAPG